MLKPDKNSIIKTESGRIAKGDSWRYLMSSGKYDLKQDTTSKNTFLIYELSDSAYLAKMAMLPKPKESHFFKTGKSLWINEQDIEGNKLNSKDLKGDILVINFWFINCIPCRVEISELNKIVDQYKDSTNIKFIAIATDGDSELKKFLKEMPFKYQIVADGGSTINSLGITSFPTHAIIDREGKVYFHTNGLSMQTTYWIKKAIQELTNK